MVKVSAPEKVCIAGEWAVLEKGNPLIVASINKRIFAEVKESKDEFIYITIKDFRIQKLKAFIKNQKLFFEKKLTKEEKQHILFIRFAIESVVKYLGKINSFEITTWSEKTSSVSNEKSTFVGTGTSAASTVAIVSGILKFHNKDIKKKPSKGKIYKLSAIAHYLAQGKVGSGFGIASSTFGGIIVYKRFDPSWLIKKINSGISFSEIVAMEWPDLYINSLYIPPNFDLLLGWTGKLSSTTQMIKKMNKWKEIDGAKYRKIIKKISILIEKIIVSWKKEDKEKIIILLRENENLLKELGEKSGVDIETKELSLLSNIANKYQGVGKVSGAGGGDCEIAITFDKDESKKIINEWSANGIEPINIKLSIGGVKEES